MPTPPPLMPETFMDLASCAEAETSDNAIDFYLRVFRGRTWIIATLPIAIPPEVSEALALGLRGILGEIATGLTGAAMEEGHLRGIVRERPPAAEGS